MPAQDPTRMPLMGRLPIDAASPYGVRSGLRGQLAEWQLTWRERQYAARVCKELLALYRAAAADHPELARQQLYQRVVMQRSGCDSATAQAILESAQEGYADWPACHELTLCDLAHYLSATEFLAAHQGEQWIHSNLAPVIALHLPLELCLARKAGAGSAQPGAPGAQE